MSNICKNFIEFKKSIRDDEDSFCPDDAWQTPKSINIIEKEYNYNMSIDPELKKYIDKTIDKKVENIKKKFVLITEESLARLWDNEYDERWDNY